MNIAPHLLINIAALLPMTGPQLRKLHGELKRQFEQKPSRNVSQDIETVEQALREKGEEI